MVYISLASVPRIETKVVFPNSDGFLTINIIIQGIFGVELSAFLVDFSDNFLFYLNRMRGVSCQGLRLCLHPESVRVALSIRNET